jgi:hypothetical protein
LFDWVFCLATIAGQITYADVRNQRASQTGDLALSPDTQNGEQRGQRVTRKRSKLYAVKLEQNRYLRIRSPV